MPGQYGMTLREWYAGMALQSVINDWSTGWTKAAVREIARGAFEIADAMIAEDEKSREN
jgi:hypothetical protein